MKLYRFRLCFLLAIALACQEKASDHSVFRYYPQTSVFEDGYVSKYYYHYYPDNPDKRAATEVGYTKYLMLDDTRFKLESYNAGFEWQSERYFVVDEDSIKLERGRERDRGSVTDTTDLNIVGGIQSVWEGKMKSPYQLLYNYSDVEYHYSVLQRSVVDTVILDKPAKVFSTEWSYLNTSTDEVVSEGTTRSFYVQGLGYYGGDTKGQDYRQEVELVEQMSVKEFERRADHGEHRTAYIDPELTISKDEDFRLCGHIKEVADYYNSTPDGRYIHGKRAMLDTIFSNLDETKLLEQNGRLVFRFVVNCEGEAGRFIAEGYDFNYQPLPFEQETIDHLYDILEKLGEWRPVVIREEARDAYFYITFTIENGKITDILP